MVGDSHTTRVSRRTVGTRSLIEISSPDTTFALRAMATRNNGARTKRGSRVISERSPVPLMISVIAAAGSPPANARSNLGSQDVGVRSVNGQRRLVERQSFHSPMRDGGIEGDDRA